MDKIYRLDLLTLIESLQQQSATLTAELPAGLIPGVFEECKGFVRLENGEITKSAIIGKSGPQVSGPNALKYLHTVNRWLVSIERDINDTGPQTPARLPIPPSEPQYTAPLPPMTITQSQQTFGGGIFTPPPGSLPPQTDFPFPQTFVVVPRQRAPLPEALLRRLSHRERMVFRLVYTMVNGQRSIDQIKEQLHLSGETIDHVLEELRRLRAVDW